MKNERQQECYTSILCFMLYPFLLLFVLHPLRSNRIINHPKHHEADVSGDTQCNQVQCRLNKVKNRVSNEDRDVGQVCRHVHIACVSSSKERKRDAVFMVVTNRAEYR